MEGKARKLLGAVAALLLILVTASAIAAEVGWSPVTRPPEPQTLLLLGASLVVLSTWLRRAPGRSR